MVAIIIFFFPSAILTPPAEISLSIAGGSCCLHLLHLNSILHEKRKKKITNELSHLPKEIHHISTEGNKSNAGPIPHSFEDRGCISARLINMQNIRALLATRIFPPLHTLQVCTNIIVFCVSFLKKINK